MGSLLVILLVIGVIYTFTMGKYMHRKILSRIGKYYILLLWILYFCYIWKVAVHEEVKHRYDKVQKQKSTER